MGVVPPADDYLSQLRELCSENGTLLIFDEVMTGFRVAWGGAQVKYHITPDLTCLGKVIGGGLPVGAYAGPAKYMQQVSPSGPVYQAGTLSGNPLAMAGGIATLDILKEPGCYETLEERSDALARGLSEAAKSHNVPLAVNRVGSMLGIYFVKSEGQEVTNFAEATASDTAAFNVFFHAMLDRGVYLAPSAYEAWFVSLAHTDDVIAETIDAAEESLEAVAASRNT
jgi:glutamate-1-semialdehyde 2,1-aminomutase